MRSDIPIYAFTRHEATRRRVTLYRGVYPVMFDVTAVAPRPPRSTARSSRACWSCGLVDMNDLVILTKGELSGSRAAPTPCRSSRSPSTEERRRPMRKLKVIAAIAGAHRRRCCCRAGVHGALRGSLPRLDGTLRRRASSAPVHISRDARGVPTIEAANRADLAFATGFLHAQDRFFEMDLSRRLAAGELSELFGDGGARAGPPGAPVPVPHRRAHGDRRRPAPSSAP